MYKFCHGDTLRISTTVRDDCATDVEFVLLSGENQRFEIAPICVGGIENIVTEFRIPDDCVSGIYGVYIKFHGGTVLYVTEIDVVDRMKVGESKPKTTPAPATETATHCHALPEPRFTPKTYNRVLACDSGWDD